MDDLFEIPSRQFAKVVQKRQLGRALEKEIVRGNAVALAKAVWNEADHPRANDGKFDESGGGGGESGRGGGTQGRPLATAGAAAALGIPAAATLAGGRPKTREGGWQRAGRYAGNATLAAALGIPVAAALARGGAGSLISAGLRRGAGAVQSIRAARGVQARSALRTAMRSERMSRPAGVVPLSRIDPGAARLEGAMRQARRQAWHRNRGR